MLSFVICIFSAVLCLTHVVSPYTFLFITIAGFIFDFGGAVLYFKSGFLKIYYHDVLGWHTPDDSPHYSDGLSEHARCKHCGKDIMQDSQGNWFC